MSRPQGPSGSSPKRIPPPPRPEREQEVWVDEGRVEPPRGAGRKRPPAGSSRGSRAKKRPLVVPDAESKQLVSLVGKQRAKTLEPRLAEAATSFSEERYRDARKLLKPIVAEAPNLAAGRELYGLTLYRLGEWKPAIRELEAFRELTPGSVEQHPVLADCRRAIGDYDAVDELWAELRDASPSGELVTEGRMVAAGALSDRGRDADAIRLLEKGWKSPKRAKDHHLRRAYALADLYEKAADLPRARATFDWIVRQDPDFADASDRLTSLT